MAKLKAWYDAVELREDLRENRPLDASEFAVHLDQIRDGRAGKDYTDPQRFFERTYVTGSLLDLASQVVRRLSGITVETSAVFNMSTQFGGGKSHSLTALYHLATNGAKANKWKGVEKILARAEVKSVPDAAVAVFMGKTFDSLHGRGAPGEPRRFTPWGEVAWQLGGAESLAVLEKHEKEFIDPKGDAIRAMLPKGRPCLILMDEIISYVSTYRKKGYGDRLYNFLDCLAETARGEPNVAVVVSIPASDLEYTADDAADEARFKKMLDRLGKAILMSADTEIGEIIRRRLFESADVSDDGRKTATAYAEWATEHAQELAGIDPETAKARFLSAYPFHPSVLSVFERKWATLPRFQRTRGVLRLLALWVAHNHQDEHRKSTREPLVTLGLAPLENPVFRSALFEQLGSDALEGPVTTDIVGKADAHALRLDKEAPDAVKKAQLHRKAAVAILFESNGGMSRAKAEATLPEIRTAVFGPDTNMADLDEVLESLASTCFYLNWDKNRYRFGLLPNLNLMLVSRRGAVQPKAVDDRVRAISEKVFGKHTGEGSKHVERRFWPTESGHVTNKPALVLAVLGLDYPAGDKKTLDLMEQIVRNHGPSGRTYKSAVLFAAADGGDAVRGAVKDLLAWESIADEEGPTTGLDDAQRQVLKRSVDAAGRAADEAVFRAYRFVYLLGKDNKLREVPLGQITSSSAGSIVELILRELEKSDEITASVGPTRLVKAWPASVVEWSTKGLRDAFYSSPQLPRLLNPDAIRRAIADGVTQGHLGYAVMDATGRVRLQKLKASMTEPEVEVSEDAYVLRAADAVKLLEPPRLADLSVRPERVAVAPGETATFSCAGRDQYGQSYPAETVTWSATGGTIDPAGVFVAGETGGVFTVTAGAGPIQGTAEARITQRITGGGKDDDDDEGGGTPKDGTISWSGEVPLKKWMNFYTKVLSRFAGSPELSVRVGFKVTVPAAEAEGKADDIRSGLKDLGLSPDVNL